MKGYLYWILVNISLDMENILHFMTCWICWLKKLIANKLKFLRS